MKRKVELDEVEWGQVLDGLACRVQDLELAAHYYESGGDYEGNEDVSDAEEAHSLANWYRRIGKLIKMQLRDG